MGNVGEELKSEQILANSTFEHRKPAHRADFGERRNCADEKAIARFEQRWRNIDKRLKAHFWKTLEKSYKTRKFPRTRLSSAANPLPERISGNAETAPMKRRYLVFCNVGEALYKARKFSRARLSSTANPLTERICGLSETEFSKDHKVENKQKKVIT